MVSMSIDTTQIASGADALQAAYALTTSERRDLYGPPDIEFARVAAAFGSVTGVTITPEQAVIFMVLLKLVRLGVAPDHADSAVDIAGYAACLADVQAARRRGQLT